MKFKFNFSFIIESLVALFTILSLVCLLISNSVNKYGLINIWGLVILLVLCIIIVIVQMFLIHFRDINSHHIVNVSLGILFFVLIFITFTMLLNQRVDLIASQFTYDKVNIEGWNALIPSLISLGGMIISSVILTINAFLN